MINFAKLLRDRSGSSAVEFAVGAPVLLVGLVIVTDVGLAVNDRMNLDQSVRAGAEFAMNDVDDETTLEDMVKSAATGAYGQALGDVDSADIPTVDVTRLCECSDSPGVAVSCTTLCTGEIPPSIYYDFVASRSYQGIFIPDFTMATEMKVQVR
ncbi:MAG: pilus assembly protein [Parvularculaceae bacterium]|nr:pilus assembly protein [Parvularculaceae bacterium]